MNPLIKRGTVSWRVLSLGTRMLSVAMLLSSTINAANFTMKDNTGGENLLDELELRGIIPVLSSLRPYNVIEASRHLPDTGRYKQYRQLANIIYPPTGYRFQAGTEVSGSVYNHGFLATAGSTSRIGMLGALGDWSFAAVNTGQTGDLATDSTGYRWRGVTGNSDQVYVRWSGLGAHVQFGKDYLQNGLGLAVSDRQPFEQLQGHYDLSRMFRLSWFTGQLDKYIDDSGVYNRYIAGHRIEFKTSRSCIGANEYMMYGGTGRTIEWYYLLPFYIFQGEQDNRPFDDNAIWDVDAKIVVPPVRIKFEMMIDDIQIERKVKTDQEPQEIGLACNVSVAVTDYPALISQHLEYQMVTRWTYNQMNPWNRWLYNNEPLGAEYGNDFDRLSLTTTALGSNYHGELELALLRKGEGSITEPWTEPWVYDSTWVSRFPSGILGKLWTATIKGQRDYLFRCGTTDVVASVSLLMRYRVMDNIDHQPERFQDRIETRAGLAVGCHF